MSPVEFLGDSFVALILGSLIGLERQIRQNPAGLRTNALVCLGAALFVSITRLTNDESPTRVAAYVVSGVGFLGGGVILREGLNVRGIDTAATLWCSAAAGVLSGSGFPMYAAIGALLILSINLWLRPFARRIDAWVQTSGGETMYILRVVCLKKHRGDVRDEIRRRIAMHPDWQSYPVKIKQSKGGKRSLILAEINVLRRDDKVMEALEIELELRTGVLSVEWQAAQSGFS